MKKAKVFLVAILILVVSDLPDILFQQSAHYVPSWLSYAKLAFIAIGLITSVAVKALRPLAKFSAILAALVVTNMLILYINSLPVWQSTFNPTTFAGNFGGSILLKFIRIIPIITVLLILYRSPRECYLIKGNLASRAAKISWLGIKEDSISWGKLSIISAVLISLGTIILTIATVTGLTASKNIAALLGYLPIIIPFALVNSFCEGVIFRSSILATLKDALPKKLAVVSAAVFFGIAHFYGAPGGIVGVIMASLLGWYMTRSMYETGGFASAWIIHFMQDTVIFSSIYLLGGFT